GTGSDAGAGRPDCHAFARRFRGRCAAHRPALGDGSRYGAKLFYSPEATALETAGGIAQARHLLGEEAFIAVSGDIWCPHFDYSELLTVLEDEDPWGNPLPQDKRDLAWLFLVKNPPFHPEGDFALNNFAIANEGQPKLTFANIGVYRPEMFDGIAPGSHAKLGPLLRQYADQGRIGGDVYRGDWHNVGTIDQLEALNLPPQGTRP
ncbi:nucleotidyltransferase family protein, partial [Herbaspirillum huttiense]